MAQAAVICVPVLIVGMGFYLIIERPCMRPDWWRRLLPGRRAEVG